MSRERKLKILNTILGDSYNKGEESLFYCPSCEHHKKKLSINISKNVFKCWVCDWSGKNIYRIIRRHGTTDHKYEWKSFEDETEIERFSEILFNRTFSKIQSISLPDEFISLSGENLSSTAVRPMNYLKARGLSKYDIIKWKIGYCCAGKYSGRVIFPSFDAAGDLNYFVARSYDNNWKKYCNPSVSKDIVFNHPYIDFDEDLVLVEGIFDAVKAGDNSIPLLGSTLSERSKLFYEIIRNDTPVYLSLDSDAIKKTNKIIDLFLKYDVETYIINISPFKDAGEMDKKEFEQRKLSADLLNSHNYLLGRIKGI